MASCQSCGVACPNPACLTIRQWIELDCHCQEWSCEMPVPSHYVPVKRNVIYFSHS
jgi:hypothetical protein